MLWCEKSKLGAVKVRKVSKLTALLIMSGASGVGVKHVYYVMRCEACLLCHGVKQHTCSTSMEEATHLLDLYGRSMSNNGRSMSNNILA